MTQPARSNATAARAHHSPPLPVLFFAFAFAVIADPVSSVAYAIEAALRALHGDLSRLLPTMALVVGLVAVVTANYWQLVARFPKGGGAAAAAGRAFGPRWTFLPIGALVVDFVLTIGISISAAASAVIALAPALAPWRIVFALVLLVVVGGLTWFGHGGRLLFAAMTALFVVIAAAVVILGFVAPHSTGTAPRPHTRDHTRHSSRSCSRSRSRWLSQPESKHPRRRSHSWGNSTTPTAAVSAAARWPCS